MRVAEDRPKVRMLASPRQAKKLGRTQGGHGSLPEGIQVPYTSLIDNPLALASVILGLALVIAVIRAKREDLPDIVRALMRSWPPDDDGGKGPPSLPKP